MPQQTKIRNEGEREEEIIPKEEEEEGEARRNFHVLLPLTLSTAGWGTHIPSYAYQLPKWNVI